jgi:hypothetical protein
MREFFSTARGRMVAVLFCMAGLGAITWSIWSNLMPNSAVAAANDPLFVNAETGYAFHCKLKIGMAIPVVCPDTGKATGYKAELCYWTKDGHVKEEPTPVALKEDQGQPGPTFCPDCGRLVMLHNPRAAENRSPPPTEAEYKAAEAGNGQ